MSPEVRERVRKCWSGGLSIVSTRQSVRNLHGVRLTFEEVRREFAAWSWGKP